MIRDMAAHVERPMVFPLSNPTDRIEVVPADVIAWTGGRGLIATGTPWEPVAYRGTRHAVGQANNALAYPGIGLGTIVTRATRVTDGMLLAAAEAIAGLVDAGEPGAGLLPHVRNLPVTSATVAVAVALCGGAGRGRSGGSGRPGPGGPGRDVAGGVPAAGARALRRRPVRGGARRYHPRSCR